MEHFDDTFALFPDGQQLVNDLVMSCAEFQHLQQARLPVVVTQRTLVERGRAIPVVVLHGACYEGANSAVRNFNAWLRAMFLQEICGGHDPDFLIVVDVALWPPALSGVREQLVFHALCHIEQRTDEYGAPKFHDDGRPMLRMRPHDIERFEAELTRYGTVIEGFDAEEGAYTRARDAVRKRIGRVA